MSRRNEKHRQQRMAVGRIDFLGNDGNPAETLEYTSRNGIKLTIKACNEDGVPIHAYIYRGISGQPKCRVKLEELNPMTCKVEVIQNPYIDYLRQYYSEEGKQ